MMDGSQQGDGEAASNLVRLHEVRRDRLELPVTFQRRELDLLLRLYGRMVAAGEWRDYAIDHLKDRALFSVYRRTSEMPLFQIAKVPALARKQGAFIVTQTGGKVLKRGHELIRVISVFDGKLKLVRG
jgi:hypothetical protein